MLGPRGLPLRQRAGRAHAGGWHERPVRAAGADQAGARRVRAGDVPEHLGRADRRRPGGADGAPDEHHAARRATRPRSSRSPAATARRRRRQLRKQAEEVVEREVPDRAAEARRALRAGRRLAAAAARQPEVRGAARVRSAEAGRYAEDALRVDLPRQERRADPDPAARRPRRDAQRRAAIDDIRSAVAMPQWRLSAGSLRDDRRAGDRPGAVELAVLGDRRAAAGRGGSSWR